MNPLSKSAVLAALVAALASTQASAADSPKEIQALTQAKVTLVQAVQTAEQHAKGRAAKAEFESSRQNWVYDVEVVSGAKVFDVKVDAGTGAVISSVEDRLDRDD